jgi:hypothetical protein
MRAKTFISLLLTTSLALMVVALYNGFGLTESDTGAYIEKGILNIIPNDRSPFYGWFVRYTSMWSSLWYALFAQCLLLAYVLLKFIDQLTVFSSQLAAPREPDNNLNSKLQVSNSQTRSILFTIIVIVSFTCVSWVASYLMPDVFAGILLLGILLFFSHNEKKWLPLVIYALVIFLSIIVHNSHFLIVAPFSLALIVWAIIKKNKTILKRSIVLLCLSVTSWLLMCTVNAANGYDFTYSRGSHVFMMGKFVEMGLLNTYLDENCGKKNLKLCNYKGQMPDYSWDFIWDAQSPLYKTGGWDSNKVEYGAIIHDVFTTPRYLKAFARNSATATLRQLSQIQVPDRTTFQGKWSSPWQRIGTYFGDELNEYCTSKQYSDGISGTGSNYIYYLFFILSSCWILVHYRILSKGILFIYSCILFFLLLNAFVTATFSTVLSRYQNRVFWLLPATNAVLIIQYYWHYFQRMENTER